jgi:hypothetical protein
VPGVEGGVKAGEIMDGGGGALSSSSDVCTASCSGSTLAVVAHDVLLRALGSRFERSRRWSLRSRWEYDCTGTGRGDDAGGKAGEVCGGKPGILAYECIFLANIKRVYISRGYQYWIKT